jgi:hypothetical protein
MRTFDQSETASLDGRCDRYRSSEFVGIGFDALDRQRCVGPQFLQETLTAGSVFDQDGLWTPLIIQLDRPAFEISEFDSPAPGMHEVVAWDG